MNDTHSMTIPSGISGYRRQLLWPWLLLGLMTLPAFWHVLVFPNDKDGEFPGVERPTYNRYPPPAYRLAEPGDTIDRVQIYISSLAIVISLLGLTNGRNKGPWLSALSISAASFWLASNPGPTFDRWHGLGWRAIFDPSSPLPLRAGLVLAGCSLFVVAWLGAGGPTGLRSLWSEAKVRGSRPVWVGSIVLLTLGMSSLTDIEPFGYWPRWELVWGLTGFCSALLVALPVLNRKPIRWLGIATAGCLVWFGFVSSGIWLTWYHRPLNRLREVVPGRILISAMPTVEGLEIAQSRHHFKTIINLFPEDGHLRSPKWPAEMKFVERNHLNYLGSTSNPDDADDFLDLTLKTAQDPAAWPILIHCHGCMDRTPAWVGIYQFVIEGRPLVDSLRFIEQHRGYRPKASVSLLYNRVLERLAPERRKADPTAARLEVLAHGFTLDSRKSQSEESNSGDETSVKRTASSADAARLPSLTPR